MVTPTRLFVAGVAGVTVGWAARAAGVDLGLDVALLAATDAVLGVLTAYNLWLRDVTGDPTVAAVVTLGPFVVLLGAYLGRTR